MRIVLDTEAYAKFDKMAKARNMTTQQLGAEIILAHMQNKK